jgi:hypothetical protein
LPNHRDPLNEFDDNQLVLTMAFPSVFLRGTLFGRKQEEQGSLTIFDNQHIMNQYNNAGAKVVFSMEIRAHQE